VTRSSCNSDHWDSSSSGLCTIMDATMGSYGNTQSSAFPVVLRSPMMPQPAQQAMHNKPRKIVGSTIIWANPRMYVPAKKCRGKDSTKRGQKKCNKCEESKMYDNDLDHKCEALGRSRECDHFDDNNKRRCWRCWKLWSGDLDACTCPVTRGDRDDCAHFIYTGQRRYKRKT
jgi:hypothetical protein